MCTRTYNLIIYKTTITWKLNNMIMYECTITCVWWLDDTLSANKTKVDGTPCIYVNDIWYIMIYAHMVFIHGTHRFISIFGDDHSGHAISELLIKSMLIQSRPCTHYIHDILWIQIYIYSSPVGSLANTHLFSSENVST